MLGKHFIFISTLCLLLKGSRKLVFNTSGSIIEVLLPGMLWIFHLEFEGELSFLSKVSKVMHSILNSSPFPTPLQTCTAILGKAPVMIALTQTSLLLLFPSPRLGHPINQVHWLHWRPSPSYPFFICSDRDHFRMIHRIILDQFEHVSSPA